MRHINEKNHSISLAFFPSGRPSDQKGASVLGNVSKDRGFFTYSIPFKLASGFVVADCILSCY